MATARRFISTGRLPAPQRVQALVDEAYQLGMNLFASQPEQAA